MQISGGNSPAMEAGSLAHLLFAALRFALSVAK